MKASEMSNTGLAAHLQQMTNSGLFNELPPKAQEVFKEAIVRIKEYNEVNLRANIFFEDVLPQSGKLCFKDYSNVNELGMLLSKRKSK